MAFHCAHCRSTDVQVSGDRRSCLDCRGQTYEDGTPVEGTADETAPDPDVSQFHKGGGWYELPDGTTVQGEDAAREALA